MDRSLSEFSIIMLGFILIFVGMILIAMSNTQEFSGFVIIFPFVFLIGDVTHTGWIFFAITLAIVVVFLLAPLWIFRDFYKVLPEEEIYEQVRRYKACPQCGTILPIEAKYCWNCGYKFIKEM